MRLWEQVLGVAQGRIEIGCSVERMMMDLRGGQDGDPELGSGYVINVSRSSGSPAGRIAGQQDSRTGRNATYVL